MADPLRDAQGNPVWWGFDTYVAGLIADVALKLRTEGIGHPGDMTPDEWDAYLLSVETPLRVWAEGKFYGAGHTEYEAAQQAMHLFADRFGSWWD